MGMGCVWGKCTDNRRERRKKKERAKKREEKERCGGKKGINIGEVGGGVERLTVCVVGERAQCCGERGGTAKRAGGTVGGRWGRLGGTGVPFSLSSVRGARGWGLFCTTVQPRGKTGREVVVVGCMGNGGVVGVVGAVLVRVVRMCCACGCSNGGLFSPGLT